MASLQITEGEQVCRKEGGMQLGLEDETEYERIKWKSTLLILLLDFRLYITLLGQHEGTVNSFTRAVYQLACSHTERRIYFLMRITSYQTSALIYVLTSNGTITSYCV